MFCRGSEIDNFIIVDVKRPLMVPLVSELIRFAYDQLIEGHVVKIVDDKANHDISGCWQVCDGARRWSRIPKNQSSPRVLFPKLPILLLIILIQGRPLSYFCPFILITETSIRARDW